MHNGAYIDDVLRPDRHLPSAGIVLLEHDGYLGFVGAPYFVDDRLGRVIEEGCAWSRSALVTVVQTRPKPAGGCGLEGGAAERGREQAEVAERRAVVELAGDNAGIDAGVQQPRGKSEHLRGRRGELERSGVGDESRVEAQRDVAGERNVKPVDELRRQHGSRGRAWVHQV